MNMFPSPTDTILNSKMETAIQIISQFDGAVVALSAGVDSSLVAALARKALGERVIAATALSESLAPGEIEIAKRIASEIGVRHVVVITEEVHNPMYAANPTNRCYYCKNTLYHELRSLANEAGFEAILDGTQSDDLGDVRPGMLAAKEAGVKSPLVEAGFSKLDVRETARLLGLSVWDKPAMPCLSSRIPHGQEVTVEKLSQVGEAEAFIKRLVGVKDLRVRHNGDLAQIEVAPADRPLFDSESLMSQIGEELSRLGFGRVTLELRSSPRNRPATSGDKELLLPILNS